ncbi:MAG: hypothetical protein FWC22_03540 [Treponema sp.]|nr:hypothetical protein [Treponema sp.]
MIRKCVIFLILNLFISASALAQGAEWGNHPYVIRGEVYVDLEPIYTGHVDAEYPLDISAASRRALDESSLFFSAMVFGWSFNYVPGEKARQIAENIDLEQLGAIQYSDPDLRVTDTLLKNTQLHVWADYHLNDFHQRRMQVWRTGTIRNAQGTGFSPINLEEYPGWIELKKMALDDAARAALRAMLRGSEKNRPKEVTGFISLASFPRYYIEAGRWAVSARFRVQVTEIIPFAAY